MKVRSCCVAAAAVSLTACATSSGVERVEDNSAEMTRLSTDLRDPGGRVRARAMIEQVGDSLRVQVEAVDLPAGAYGAHIHSVGRCDPPLFESAGPHWNPTGHQHGKDNPQGMHRGDLPNLLVGSDGQGSFEYTIPGAAGSAAARDGLLDEDGAAVVVHAKADDFRTDPSGNSGPRMACGVLG